MKAFRFSLESVMNWHGQKADKERLELERLNRVRATIQEQRDSLAEEGLQMRQRLASNGSLQADELASLGAYLSALRVRDEQITANETECEDHIAGQRQKCIEADRQFRMLEKFKGKRRAEWQRSLDQEIEDLASTSFLANWSRDARS